MHVGHGFLQIPITYVCLLLNIIYAVTSKETGKKQAIRTCRKDVVLKTVKCNHTALHTE